MNKPSVQIDFTPLFIRFLKHVAKKYRSVRDDLQPLIDDLANGETPGDQIQHVKRTAYKVRIPNRDAQKGKSGGYRVIYYIKTSARVVLLAIYSKSEQIDISTDEILRMIESFEDIDESAE
jgi:mRNA-degrading endonuclease RelE of RelBE toxin-antitoxin system